jgi:hypothetical protein
VPSGMRECPSHHAAASERSMRMDCRGVGGQATIRFAVDPHCVGAS